jgi:hypothetical protein
MADGRDTLATLARLRHLQAVQAGRDLAGALTEERRADAVQQTAAAAFAREAACIPNDAAHPLAGSFATWLPAGQAALATAAAARRGAVAHSVAARGALAQARAAERAVEIVRDAKAEEARCAALRKAQVMLDDHKS